MTWGQLRLLLTASLPGVPPDLVDEWLNNRYEQVLVASKWIGTTYHATVETIAAYQSGTDSVNLTVGSTAVTGVGTAWTSAATLEMMFYRPGDTVVYTIVAWNSATSVTLDRPYEGNGTDSTGTSYPNESYVIMQDVYELPADVGNVISCLDPVTGFPLQPFSADEMDNSCGPRTLVQDPTCWAPWDDTNEGGPPSPVAHQIRFYPPPLHARGIAVKYEHLANGFTGSNTSASPLPWVTNSLLLYGCRADGYAYMAGATPEKASAYLGLAKLAETKWQEQLQRLLLVEHGRRRQKQAVKMADRFTRHRMARATRGQNNNWGPGQGGPN